MSDYKLGDIQSGSYGMDAFFQSEPQVITPLGQKVASAKPARIKVGSLNQLNGFQRVSAETLVHKSTQDLWSIRRDGGDFIIERLFQEGPPVKG